MKHKALLIASLICSILAAAGTWNYVAIIRPVALATQHQEVQAWAHYQHFVNPSVLCYDLRKTGTSSTMDVFGVLLQSAEALKSHTFRTVELQYRGVTRFTLEGAYFKELGNDIEQPALYTITGCMSPLACGGQTFTSHVQRLDGTEAFPLADRRFARGSTGLARMLTQMTEEADQFGKRLNQFGDFIEQWYRDTP